MALTKHVGPIGFHDGLALCFILPAFAGLVVLIVEPLCAAIGCPRTAAPLPALIAMALVIPFQRYLLGLWHQHRIRMVIITLSLYIAFGAVVIGVITGRLPHW